MKIWVFCQFYKKFTHTTSWQFLKLNPFYFKLNILLQINSQAPDVPGSAPRGILKLSQLRVRTIKIKNRYQNKYHKFEQHDSFSIKAIDDLKFW